MALTRLESGDISAKIASVLQVAEKERRRRKKIYERFDQQRR